MRSLVINLLLGALLLLPRPAICEPNEVVLYGRIVFVQSKDATDMKADMAWDVHSNTQFIAIEMTRVLAGRDVNGTVLVGLEIDDLGAYGVEKLSESYGVLAKSVWHPGPKVIIGARESRKGGCSCSPPAFNVNPLLGDLPGIPPGTKKVYFDNSLQPYYGKPIFCAKIDDIFFVK